MGISLAIGLAASVPATAGMLTTGGAASPVPYVVSAAAQRAAVAFWTPGRMEQAATAGTRAADPGPSPADPGPSPTASPKEPGGGPPTGTPTAVKFAGIPTVGTLFYTTGTQKHFCTASVTD